MNETNECVDWVKETFLVARSKDREIPQLTSLNLNVAKVEDASDPRRQG